MTKSENTTSSLVWVAIDVSKARFDILAELPDGQQKKFKLANTLEDYQKLIEFISKSAKDAEVGLEATGNYHRTLAYYLASREVKVNLISSLALARTREALTNSWDKNDPGDAKIILHMLKNHMTQLYYDPLIQGFNDIQEISKTYYLVTLRKTKTQHGILNHLLPLYFPEMERFYHSSRGEWFARIIIKYPCPKAITKFSEEEFIQDAWSLPGRKVGKRGILRDIYLAAKSSVALPVEDNSDAIAMFKLLVEDYISICKKRSQIEEYAHERLKDNQDYNILRSIPGIGPIIALTVIAEAGDLRRFKHHRQFLKYCGFDLSTHQSGQFRGQTKLSKRGNARLRAAFWMAAQVAVRMRENTFREKFENGVKSDPKNKDLKRKIATATAIKLARVAHTLIKNNTQYRPYYDAAIPGGRIHSNRAVEA